MKRLKWTGCAVVAALAMSCGSRQVVVDPFRAAEERAIARARAHETREVFEVRLNPTGCEAPPFEVRLPGEGAPEAEGVWQRVFLEPDDPQGPVAALATRFETSLATGAGPLTLRVRGRLLSKTRRAANRSPYPVLVVLGECEGASCGDDVLGAPSAPPPQLPGEPGEEPGPTEEVAP